VTKEDAQKNSFAEMEPIAQRLSLAIVEEHELVLCATKQL
jgi:hypothetical protein